MMEFDLDFFRRFVKDTIFVLLSYFCSDSYIDMGQKMTLHMTLFRYIASYFLFSSSSYTRLQVFTAISLFVVSFICLPIGTTDTTLRSGGLSSR